MQVLPPSQTTPPLHHPPPPPRVVSVRTSTQEQFVRVGKYLCYVERTKRDRLRENANEEEFSQDQFSAHRSSVWVGEKRHSAFWFRLDARHPGPLRRFITSLEIRKPNMFKCIWSHSIHPKTSLLYKKVLVL